MGYIRERDLSDGSKRFYAEVQLKGGSPRVPATFNRKSKLDNGIKRRKFDGIADFRKTKLIDIEYLIFVDGIYFFLYKFFVLSNLK